MPGLTGGTNLSNFNYQFGAGDMTRILDQLNKLQSNTILQQGNQQIAQGNQNTAARLASQGITGGSILNNAVRQNEVGQNSALYNALQQLAQGRLGQQFNVMNTANQQGFQLASGRSNALMQALGLGDTLAQQSSGSTFEDILAVLNTVGATSGGAGNLIKAIKG